MSRVQSTLTLYSIRNVLPLAVRVELTIQRKDVNLKELKQQERKYKEQKI